MSAEYLDDSRWVGPKQACQDKCLIVGLLRLLCVTIMVVLSCNQSSQLTKSISGDNLVSKLLRWCDMPVDKSFFPL
jgi:hypothetical protein